MFAATGPQVWNRLPPNLRPCGLSYSQFRWLLRYLYSAGESTAQCELLLTVPNRNILIYLLRRMSPVSSVNQAPDATIRHTVGQSQAG